MTEKITVLGAGNGGLATAFQLSSLGMGVTLWAHPDFSKNLDRIRRKGGIEAVDKYAKDGIEIDGKLSGFVTLGNITTDMEEAMGYSDTLLLILPTFAHEAAFRLAMPHLKSGQDLVIMPGNFSSLVFAKMMRDAGVHKDIQFVETNTLPYGCRIVGEGQVLIIMVRKMIKAASFPGNRGKDALRTIEDILPMEIKTRKNILEASFANPNLITHSVTAVLNMGWIENADAAFHFYKEGMSESISRAIQRIDEERISIGARFNLSLIPYLDILAATQGRHYSNLHEYVVDNPLKATIGYDSPRGPKDRYITEDTPYLLVPVHEFGKLAKTPHPIIESIIHIAGVFNDCNYFETGRTLEKMGLDNMSIEQIDEYLEALRLNLDITREHIK
jgi:opine dehydrogenase